MKTTDDTAIHASLADATFQAYREAVIHLPPDVVRVIRKTAAAETKPVAHNEFTNILKNIEEAERLSVPALPGHRCTGGISYYSPGCPSDKRPL